MKALEDPPEYSSPSIIATTPQTYRKSTSGTDPAKVLQDLFNHDIDFQTPNSKFKNFYTHWKEQQEVWVEYNLPHLSYHRIASIKLGSSRKYKYGIVGDYYLLRHKRTGNSMDFWIVAKQYYDEFSLGKWLDPFNHIFLGVYTDTKSTVSYFQASFDKQKGEYQVEAVNGVGDCDNYMSIRERRR